MLLLVALALMQDSVVTGYLEQLCGKLGSHPEVTLAEDPAPRATALPNGSVRVTNGMVAGAATEAELAGILAHELAHLQLARESQAPETDAETGLCLRFAHSEPKFPGGSSGNTMRIRPPSRY